LDTTILLVTLSGVCICPILLRSWLRVKEEELVDWLQDAEKAPAPESFWVAFR